MGVNDSVNGAVVGLIGCTQVATWEEDPARVDFRLIGPASSKNYIVMNSAKGAIKFSSACEPSKAHKSDISIQVSIVCGYLCPNSSFPRIGRSGGRDFQSTSASS